MRVVSGSEVMRMPTFLWGSFIGGRVYGLVSHTDVNGSNGVEGEIGQRVGGAPYLVEDLLVREQDEGIEVRGQALPVGPVGGLDPARLAGGGLVRAGLFPELEGHLRPEAREPETAVAVGREVPHLNLFVPCKITGNLQCRMGPVKEAVVEVGSEAKGGIEVIEGLA